MQTNKPAINRQVIDLTNANDDEVVLVPSVMLSDIACDALTALDTFNDITTLLYMIMNGTLQQHQVKAFASFAYESASSRADTQLDVMRTLNKALAQSKFGIVEVK